MQEIPGEKCAVFGIYDKGVDVSRTAFFGLFALQHRGQESSGIAVSDGERIASHKNIGLVTQVFTEGSIEALSGHIAIGHNRYSTSKSSSLEYAQPFIADNRIALAHNGNLPSTTALKSLLKFKGIPTEAASDSRLMVDALGWHLKRGLGIEEAMRQCFPLFTGAFSIVAMTKDSLIAARDAYGIRPLVLGKLNGGYVVASETCALYPIGATFIREVAPGEMLIVDEEGLRSVELAPPNQKLDIFEFIYFARHDSELLGKSVYDVRKNFGKHLARECKLEADVVVPVPETSIPMAVGFAQESGIPYEMGLTKNRYIQRTFIEPDQRLREQGVKMKLTPLPHVLSGKRVVVIDDSIVRGTTSRQVVQLLFEAGAKEVHFLVSSPPIRFPDFYGIDISKQDELLAFNRSVEEMRAYLGATSLYFLSIPGMIEATGIPGERFNTSCFTGTYPIDLKERSREFVSLTHAA